MNVIEHLSTLSDPRESSGKRHQLEFVLVLSIMSIMSDYNGFRAMGDFVKKHRQALIKNFSPPKNRLPSYSTFRRVFMSLDNNELSRVFYNWAKEYIPIEPGEWMSIDGKALRGTVRDYDNPNQNFVALVSIFRSRLKMTLASKSYENGKQSEPETVRQLIKTLDLEGCVFTLDAIHCQKKLLPQL